MIFFPSHRSFPNPLVSLLLFFLPQSFIFCHSFPAKTFLPSTQPALSALHSSDFQHLLHFHLPSSLGSERQLRFSLPHNLFRKKPPIKFQSLTNQPALGCHSPIPPIYNTHLYSFFQQVSHAAALPSLILFPPQSLTIAVSKNGRPIAHSRPANARARQDLDGKFAFRLVPVTQSRCCRARQDLVSRRELFWFNPLPTMCSGPNSRRPGSNLIFFNCLFERHRYRVARASSDSFLWLLAALRVLSLLILRQRSNPCPWGM